MNFWKFVNLKSKIEKWNLLKFLIALFAISLIPVAFAQTDNTSDKEVKAMVLDAINLYDEIGKDSFESFNSSPDFHKSDLYMFVFRDSDSIMMAHGANTALIGESVDKILDFYGESIGKMIHDKATQEGVWVEYLWEDPVDKETHPKTVWVVKHDGYIFGTGSYSDAEPTSVEPQIEPSELRATSFEVIIPVGSPLEGCENLNTCYVPYQAEINSGESVIWNNIDSAPHTITSGASETPDGIFDSGLGGLTVLDAVQHRMPDLPLAYMGDNAHAPYGVRDADDVYQLTQKGVERL